MKKIKIFYDTWPSHVEEQVNRFIQEHNVIDMQYASSKSNGSSTFSVMVVYEEEK